MWSLWSPSVVTTLLLCALSFCLPSCIELIALYISFVPWLCTSFCAEDWVCILCGVLSGKSWNPSRWRRGLELGDRTSKYILVFAFGSLSWNSTLFISYIAIIFHLYMLGIILLFTLVLIQESYWSTSTLIKENLEEKF